MFLEKVESDYLNSDSGLGRVGISLIGKSSAAASLRRMVQLSAATNAPLMLSGPRGSGKRDVAATIHARSNHASAGFLSIHSKTLSKHFRTIDRFASAHAGTVFFDEIGNFPESQHNVLFQLIRARNIRIICATTKSTNELIDGNTLPSGLCAALSVLTLPVPPLTDRRADLPLLLEAYVHQLPKEKRFTLRPSAAQFLHEHHWPGNFSDLRDIVNALGNQYAGSRVSTSHIVKLMRSRSGAPLKKSSHSEKAKGIELTAGFDLQRHLANIEVTYIEQALEQANGVVQKASEIIGIKRTTLVAKMKKYTIGR